MNITVTGARGFVGRVSAALLADAGHEVTCLARPEWDALLPEAWNALPDGTDVVIHTASILEGQSPEDVLWKTNVAAMMGLVRRSRELSRLSHIIFCSSGAVYEPQAEPVELYTEPRPRTAYGMSKLLGETMLRHGCTVPVTNLRLFFPFGPGQGLPRLIPRLINSVRTGKAVTLRNADGTPRINPLPVSRAAACIAALTEESNPPASRTINLGGPVTLSMKELAEKIGQRSGRAPLFEIQSPGGIGCLHCAATEASGAIQEFEDTLTAAVTVML